MNPKVKALIWEECRVSGAISACVLMAGLLVLLSYKLRVDANVMIYEADYLLMIMGAPMSLALLLILTPGNSGILSFGFSRRILRLPVSTSVAVAVALFLRTLFVFLVATLTMLASHALFDLSPGFQAVILITLLYLAVQLLDWIRAAVSGLTSLLLLIVAATPIYLMFSDSADLSDILQPLQGLFPHSLEWSLTFLVCAIAASYIVALVAVDRTRKGRQVGIPEIWEWPSRLSLPTLSRRPFSSPIAAQVWWEFRRSGWILPRTTLLVYVLIGGAALALGPWEDGVDWLFQIIGTYLVIMGLFVGALVQAADQHSAGFQEKRGNLAYQHLRPMTDAQYASARTITNALSLFPTLLLALVFEFGTGGYTFTTEIIPHALELEVTSYREIGWILFSHGTLFGLLAWSSLAIAAPFFGWTMAISTTIFLSVEYATHNTPLSDSGIWQIPVFLFLSIRLVFVGANTWRRGLVPLRMLAGWGSVWLLATWLLYAKERESFAELIPTSAWDFIGLSNCLGLAALVPLPCFAVLVNLHRKRLGRALKQDPAQHANTIPFIRGPRTRAIASVLVVIMVLGTLWISWPRPPAYHSVWKESGRPTTLSELEASYPPVPPEENLALNYLELATERESYDLKFRTVQKNRVQTYALEFEDQLLFTGYAQLGATEAIPADVWDTTESYWKTVTSRIVPALKQISWDKESRSRYPINLRYIYDGTYDHLSDLENLTRELQLDALHWSVFGDSAKAAESIVSIFPLAHSLSKEPMLDSQYTRISLVSMGYVAIVHSMNRISFTELELARMQRAFEHAFPPLTEPLLLARGVIGDGVQSLSAVKYRPVFSNQRMTFYSREMPFGRLLSPKAADQFVLASLYEDLLSKGRLPYATRDVEHGSFELFESVFFVAQVSSILSPWLYNGYQPEWKARTKANIATTVIAVERYRLAYGILPNDLTALVPEFMSEPPRDYMQGANGSLGYIQRADEEYLIYSFGTNMRDDGGSHDEEYTEREDYKVDITFTVAPLSVRQGEKIMAHIGQTY